MIRAASHYPYVTRMVMSLFDDGALTNVRDVHVEPEYGYATMIRYVDGTRRMTRGNDVGLNSSAASEVVKDKAYTKHFLRLAGIDTPKGESFLLGWWADRIRDRMKAHGVSSLRTADQAWAYIRAATGYPVYVKPVNGSNGANVWRVNDDDELDRVVSGFERERVRVMLVEAAVDLPDYRLVVLDNELISAYRRNPLTVTGNGVSTVSELRQGNAGDERVASRLARLGLTWDSVLPDGEQIRLLDISNLSAGGTAEDVTAVVSERWQRLATTAASLFGLRFCGVDLACADIEGGEGRYAMLEINGSPGLDRYGTTGPEQQSLVRNLYIKVLNSWGR